MAATSNAVLSPLLKLWSSIGSPSTEVSLASRESHPKCLRLCLRLLSSNLGSTSSTSSSSSSSSSNSSNTPNSSLNLTSYPPSIVPLMLKSEIYLKSVYLKPEQTASKMLSSSDGNRSGLTNFRAELSQLSTAVSALLEANPNSNTSTVKLISLLVALRGTKKADYNTISQSFPQISHQLSPPLKLPPPPPPAASSTRPQDPAVSAVEDDFKLSTPSIPSTEYSLLKSCLYTLQGITTKYVDFSTSPPTQTQDLKLLPPGHHGLLIDCASAGFYYTQIKSFTTRYTDSPSLVQKSFSQSVDNELAHYFALIATLENTLSQKTNDPPSFSALTVRGLALHLQTPLGNLQTLKTLTDGIGEDCIGGELICVLKVHGEHGDPYLKRVVDGIVERSAGPVMGMVERWVREGELGRKDIEESEFFITEDTSVTNDDLYGFRYNLNARMLIPSITPALANKILSVGRDINFLRKCCVGVSADAGFFSLRTFSPGVHFTSDELKKAFTYGNPTVLEKVITAASRETSQEILKVVKDQYNLSSHLSAMKKFLLLGQGDFVSALLDAVGPELGKRAEAVYRHNIVGVLDTALRGTNAQYLPQYVLDRCGIKLYEPSPGDSGWDIFSLDYHVESPLTAVVHAKASSKYRRIFHMLWRLKRIEWGLNNTWRRATGVSHSLRANEVGGTIKKALRKVALARQEMLHVTSNIQNYLMFEVLEGSWAAFSRKFAESSSLDDIIKAHDEYLDNILHLGLLGEDPESKRLSAQLALVFDIADRFCSVQDRVFVDCLSALGSEATRAEEAQRRIQKGDWGFDGDGNLDASAIDELGLKSLEGVEATTVEFEEGLKGLLKLLVGRLSNGALNQGHDALRFLTFRLDFNQFYEQKYSKKAEDSELDDDRRRSFGVGNVIF
ncbi:hypothetical protein TrVE_jg13013 [Triparma verrucosa]|uniref:Spindle pole body component n=1 Tax=Triparma verrucosa TaxID=1606542 RepID=A0A9W7F3X0_9STRA|nr:hypothetical protein TrVE_jg13013 [Triparma verrucosa]